MVGIAKPREKLKATVVSVIDYRIKDVPATGEMKKDGKIVVFECEHPDSNKSIFVQNARFEKNNKLKTEGIWYDPDEEENIPYESALANLMRHLNVDNLEDMKNRIQVETVEDEKGYLVFKAY